MLILLLLWGHARERVEQLALFINQIFTALAVWPEDIAEMCNNQMAYRIYTSLDMSCN
jgi:hypothetical protein